MFASRLALVACLCVALEAHATEVAQNARPSVRRSYAGVPPRDAGTPDTGADAGTPDSGVPPWSNTYSVLFDGADERAQSTYAADMDGQTAVTISFWVKAPGGWDPSRMFAGKYASAGDRRVYGAWSLSSDKTRSDWYDQSDVSGLVISSNASALGNWLVWHHWCGTWDTGGTNNKLWYDGVEIAITTSGTLPTSALKIDNVNGISVASLAGGANWFAGNVDELAIWNSVESCNTIYGGAPQDLSALSTPPVHWYRMGDGDTAPTLLDSGSGTATSLTMYNMEAGDIEADVP